MVLIYRTKKKAAAVFKERFSLLGNHYSSHSVLTQSMQCFDNRHFATHSRFSKEAAGQLSLICKTGIQHPCWQANNLLTFSSISLWTFHGKGLLKMFLFFLSIPPSTNIKPIFTSKCTKSPHESFNFITYPTKQQDPGPCLRRYFRASDSWI